MLGLAAAATSRCLGLLSRPSAGAALVTRNADAARVAREDRRHRHDRRKKYHITYEMKSKFYDGSDPYVHGEDNNLGFSVDGVSDRQFPVMLQWERPARVSRVHPGADGSGDLSGLPDVDPAEPVLRMEELEEFAAASDDARRVFSFRYRRSRDLMERIQRDTAKLVRQHRLDGGSLEAAIARKTVIIRHMQARLEALPDYRANPPLKHVLKLNVDQRRGYLARLRESDYKKFEWLLERLDLVYRPRPFYWDRVEREKCLGRLTDLWCQELKEHRLATLEDQFKRRQPGYLREKAETLRWMRKEQEELGLEVTVTDEQVEECLRRAGEVEEELRERDRRREEAGDDEDGGGGDDRYFVYKPEVEDDSQKYLSR